MPEDVNYIRIILADAWVKSYEKYNVHEYLYRYLEDKNLFFLLPKSGENVWLAFIGEIAVGVLVIKRFRNIDYILGLYISSLFQRRGIGRMLIEHFLNQTSYTIAPIRVEVLADGFSVIEFYQEMRFVVVDSLQINIFDNQFADILVMERKG